MADETVKGRRYDGRNRARQARETRRRIVDAAAVLFERDGYGATSISAIAREAQVAVPTVYAALRSKAGILRAVIDVSLTGDDEEVAVADRSEWQAMQDEDDPRRKLTSFVRLHRRI